MVDGKVVFVHHIWAGDKHDNIDKKNDGKQHQDMGEMLISAIQKDIVNEPLLQPNHG